MFVKGGDKKRCVKRVSYDLPLESGLPFNEQREPYRCLFLFTTETESVKEGKRDRESVCVGGVSSYEILLVEV